jgi:hypothetical protein
MYNFEDNFARRMLETSHPPFARRGGLIPTPSKKIFGRSSSFTRRNFFLVVRRSYNE